MARARAVVIGAGIGGLAAAAGLCSAGWDVTACERATSLEPVGAGLALAPNGLRALDVIGAGDPLRALAVPQELGIRRSDGRWLMRSTTGHMVADRFGDPVILVPRAAVIDALTARVPDGVLSLGTEVTSVEPGGNAAARICTAAGDLEADLVVAADGIGSATRSALFPAHPGLRHTGLTTWRLLTKPVTGQVPMAESWGRGTVFGVMPLSDGRVYCYAAASAAPGTRAGDELAELARLFGTWHEPIPALLATARPQDVLRHDVAELAAPLPSLHRGRAMLLGDAAHPMTPNLGQGACQALEDAAVISRLAAGTQPDQVAGLLNSYTAARRPRTTDVVRWSRRAATMTTWTSPPAITARNVLIRLTGKLAPGAALRSLTPVYDWQPPASAPPAGTPGYRLLANRGGGSADAELTMSARGWYAYRAGRLASSLLPVTDALWTPDSVPADRGVRRLPVTRAAVRDAALRLFAERGYQLTTMMDIGAALGIRGPSLYKHVASKQELLAEIMTETMTTLIARQQAAVDAGGSPDVQLRRAVEAHVRYHATHKEHALVGNREIGSLDEPTRAQVVELRSAYERGLRAIIERGCAAGAFSTAHPWLVSYAILDMGMGLSSWYHADGEYDVDALAYAYANLAAQMAGVPTA